MYNQDFPNHPSHPRSAAEIDMHAKMQEKKFSLLRARFRDEATVKPTSNPLKKTALMLKTLFISMILR